MGNCGGGASDAELKMTKINTEKFKQDIMASNDPKVKAAAD